MDVATPSQMLRLEKGNLLHPRQRVPSLLHVREEREIHPRRL